MADALFKFVLSEATLGTHEVTAPSDWQTMQHVIKRDRLYHGVGISYTLDFTFVKSALGFLLTVYNTQGVEADIALIIYERDENEHEYFASYVGKLNLLKAIARAKGEFTVNAQETGFQRDLLNAEDIAVDLYAATSLDGTPIASLNALVPLMLHSKATVKTYEAGVTSTQPEYTFRPVSRADDCQGTLYIGFDDEKNNEFNAFQYSTGMELSDGIFETIEFKEEGRITVNYSLDILVECLVDDGDFDEATVNWYLGINLTDRYPDRGEPQAKRIYHWNNREVYGGDDNINGDFSHNIKKSGSVSFDVKIGDKLYYYGDAAVLDKSSPLFGDYVFEWRINASPANHIKISGATTTTETQAVGILLYEAFFKLTQFISGRNNAFYSELLGRTDSYPTQYAQDGELSKIWLSNGSQIRGFPYTERPIYATFKEAFAAVNSARPIGMSIEVDKEGAQYVRIEGVEHYYTKEVVLDLGGVAGLEMTPAEEYYYNQVEVGYEKWGSNQDNSLDEVATKQSRTLPMKAPKATYSVLSKYSASGYLLEDTRRQQYALEPNKETDNDKTNFFVCVLRTTNGAGYAYETERNQKLIVCDNVLDPNSIYNARIWPFRNFLRHGCIIRAGLRFREDKTIAFQEGNANYTAKTQFIGEAEPITENQPITGAELAAPLWIPEYYTFTAPLPLFKRRLLEANPYGLITFTDEVGSTKYGYLIEVTADLYKRTGEFKLLRANI
jgi:hypothetical protein